VFTLVFINLIATIIIRVFFILLVFANVMKMILYPISNGFFLEYYNFANILVLLNVFMVLKGLFYYH
jgi:hypothetical protein